MNILRQIGIIMGVLLASETLVRIFSLPIPSNVLGMLLLFVLLCLRVVKPSQLREVTDFLYHHMAFFLIPATCAVVADYTLLSGAVAPFLLVTVLSTLCVFAASGWAVQGLQRLMRRAGHREEADK